MSAQVNALNGRLFLGVTPAMATPLRGDGRVDTAEVARLVTWLIDLGVAGIFAGGTTGEGLLLPLAERRMLHEAAVAAAAGRVPVLVHAGTNNTTDTLTLAQHAAGIGADGVVVITPTFYPLPHDALAAYFQAIADAIPDIPLLLYDIPHMAVNGVTPRLLGMLADTVPNLAGVKSSRADAQVVRQLIDAAPHVAVYAGNERIALGLLALGARGLISGLATAMPEPFVALAAAARSGDWATARQIQQIINRLLDVMPAGQRIGAIKTILASRGLAVGQPLPPRPACPDSTLWSRLQAIWPPAS